MVRNKVEPGTSPGMSVDEEGPRLQHGQGQLRSLAGCRSSSPTTTSVVALAQARRVLLVQQAPRSTPLHPQQARSHAQTLGRQAVADASMRRRQASRCWMKLVASTGRSGRPAAPDGPGHHPHAVQPRGLPRGRHRPRRQRPRRGIYAFTKTDFDNMVCGVIGQLQPAIEARQPELDAVLVDDDDALLVVLDDTTDQPPSPDGEGWRRPCPRRG